MRSKSVLFLAQAAMIAAVYVVLVFVFPASSAAIQVRVAEALTILPFFTPAAIPGLAIGCLLANLLTGCVLIDVIAGSLATLVAACLTYALRKHKFLAPVPPIVLNVLVVPWIIKYAYGNPWPVWLIMITVGIGEIISCGGLGLLLLFAIKKLPVAIQDRIRL